MVRVLIVEDAIEMARMLQDTLRTVHPEIAVSIVPSAEEALLEASRLTIDLLVSDLRLPGMNGLELVRKVRARQPQVKVMLMTGLAEDDQMVRQSGDVHPDMFFRKPLSGSEFLHAVETLLAAESPAPGMAAAGAPSGAPAEARSEEQAVLREIDSLLPGEPAPPTRRVGASPTGGRGTIGQRPAPASEPADAGLSGVLSRMRGSLGALSAMLLDESGHPLAQAGNLPESLAGEQLLPAVMAALSAGAKVSYLLGPAARSVQAYRGEAVDLLIAPVGQYALLLALRPGRSAVRLALAFEEALHAQQEAGEALEAMGLRVHSAAETSPDVLLAELDAGQATAPDQVPAEILDTPLGQDPGLEKFEELFVRKQTGQLRLQDPDSFWDEVAVDQPPEDSQPGMLSFDQAQKLGLLPEDE